MLGGRFHCGIREFDGEPRFADVVLGAALGYERSRAIRQLIERLTPKLCEFGRLPHRGATSHDGAGAREVTEYLLNLGQINYLITRCSLPAADEWCIQIARVFTAWQTGKLLTLDLDGRGHVY